MSEVIKNKYLDFSGLQKYDELIKGLIKSGYDELAAKIGTLEIEGSDDKNITESIAEIYTSIAEIVNAQGALEDKDKELADKINEIIGELEGSDVTMTLAEINNELTKLNGSVSKNAQGIVDVTSRVDILEQTVADLGEIDGGEGLAGVVNKVNANAADIATLKGDGEGSVKKTANDAATAAATQALTDAKAYADGLAGNYDAAGTAAGFNDAMNERVVKLEAIDHDQIVADAIAAVVAGAESEFDTLKEVADWIAADKEGSAALQTTVSEHTTSINTINGELDALEAKVDGDIANLTQHITDAANALAQVETALDARIDVLEAFEETHESISLDTIEGLFA